MATSTPPTVRLTASQTSTPPITRGSRTVSEIDTSTAETAPEDNGAEMTEEDAVDKFVNSAAKKGVSGFRKEFVRLKSYRPKNPKHDAFLAHPNRNRYANVVCLDATRTVLKVNVPPESDYIHASWIKLHDVGTRFIAAQFPLQETVPDFWRLCFQESVFTILLLCNISDRDEDVHFWPVKRGEEANYGHITVCHKKIEKERNYEVFFLELVATDCFLTTVPVKLVRMTNWPSDGVPNGLSVLMMLHRIIKGKPCMVVCSDGVGRSCTTIAIEAVKQRLLNGVSVKMKDIVKEMRNQRACSITNESQYLFIISTILEYIKVRFPGQNRYRRPALQFQAGFQANLQRMQHH